MLTADRYKQMGAAVARLAKALADHAEKEVWQTDRDGEKWAEINRIADLLNEAALDLAEVGGV